MRILHVTPTYFSSRSVIGGGERYVTNICRAVLAVAPPGSIGCSIASFSPEPATLPIEAGLTMHLVPGRPDDIPSMATDAFDALIAAHDVVHVHQCLLPFGIFVAARARMAGKLVLGTDHGGGEYPALESYPRLGQLFDAFHAQSDFAAHAFAGLGRPVALIRGPVDDATFVLEPGRRERGLLVALGRLLPHKGHDRVIAALPAGTRLVVAGGTHAMAYFDLLRELASGKAVQLETALNDGEVMDLLRRAAALVHGGTHFGPDGAFYHKPELLALAPLEAMCTGTPAIVSRAGALAELDVLCGCRTYGTPRELAALLEEAVASQAFDASPEAVRDDAVARYGLRQFGVHYLALLERTRCVERQL
jgi:glycosyltransferase involved in cell wall biosynthesis